MVIGIEGGGRHWVVDWDIFIEGLGGGGASFIKVFKYRAGGSIAIFPIKGGQ